jgi:NTP pyrophosphatase (non-canonical NTP hydrolase)
MTTDMNIYQQRASVTAVYPEMGTGSTNALAYCALGLGEAGEVQGKIKKILRGDSAAQTVEYGAAVAAELGDLLWYVAMTAKELGYNLSEIANANLDKLESRAARGQIKGSGDDR